MNDFHLGSGADEVAERAAALFNHGLCCSESVLQAVAESCGIKSELIPRIATGFCGGIARSGDVCGAVTGGVLAISLLTGRSSPGEPREQNHRLIQEFVHRFRAQFGTSICRELIGCRLDTPDGHRYFVENNLRARCAVFTREAARIVAELLADR